MTKSNKSKVSKKKPYIPLYRIKLLERNIIRNAQNYYYNSEIIPPVGNPNTWNIEEESVYIGNPAKFLRKSLNGGE